MTARACPLQPRCSENAAPPSVDPDHAVGREDAKDGERVVAPDRARIENGLDSCSGRPRATRESRRDGRGAGPAARRATPPHAARPSSPGVCDACPTAGPWSTTSASVGRGPKAGSVGTCPLSRASALERKPAPCTAKSPVMALLHLGVGRVVQERAPWRIFLLACSASPPIRSGPGRAWAFVGARNAGRHDRARLRASRLARARSSAPRAGSRGMHLPGARACGCCSTGRRPVGASRAR